MAPSKIEPPATDPPEGSVDAFGWQLRAALPPLRLHCVAIFDGSGEVLWLSESVLGPDEQGFAIEALQTFTPHSATAPCETDFLDGRGAVCFPLRTRTSRLAGTVMIVVDAKALAAGNLSARLSTPPVRALLDRLGETLPPLVASTSDAAETPDERNLETTPLDPLGELTVEIIAPETVEEILTFELPGVSLAESPPATVSAASAPALKVQELAKLRPGGRLRRFDVLCEAPQTTGEQAAERLLARMETLGEWLNAAWGTSPATFHFSLAVPATALEVAGLPERLHDGLRAVGAQASAIGLQIDESLYGVHRKPIEELVEALEQLGSFLVIDAFTFDARALELLRSRAVRLVKVHPELVGTALRDRLAQARVVAICQAARVLGIHCAASQVGAQAAKRWLTAAGFDFAQGPLFKQPQALEALAAELA